MKLINETAARKGPEGARPGLADGLLTAPEAARYLRVSLRWLQSATAAGHILRVSLRQPGAQRGPVRYRREDLDAYVRTCQVSQLGTEDNP